MATLTTLSAEAALLSVSSLTPNTTIGWGALGAEGTALGTTVSLSPATVTGSTFGLLTGSSYNADFSPTEFVLAMVDLNTGDPATGAFDVQLASAAQGVGAQLQANSFGAFNVLVEAFDASNSLLGSFTLAGSNNGNGDGSALFAGVMSDGLDIVRIRFSGLGAGAAMGSLLLDTQVDRVPEPGSLLLAALAIGALVGQRRRNV